MSSHAAHRAALSGTGADIGGEPLDAPAAGPEPTATRNAVVETLRAIAQIDADSGASDRPDYKTSLILVGSAARSALARNSAPV